MLKQAMLMFLLCCTTLISAFYLPANQEKEPVEKYVPVPDTIVNDNVPPIPSVIKERLKQYSNLVSTKVAAVDPRGGGIIVSSRQGDTDTKQLYWVDKPLGQLKQITDYKEPVSDAYFCPDPAKHYFLFTKDAGGAENYQIYKYNLDNKEVTLLTDGKSRHMFPIFNAKGDKVAFSGNGRTGRYFDIYIMDPDNPKEANIVFKAEKSAYYFATTWMPDNRNLLILEYLAADRSNTLLVDTVTGEVKTLTPKSQQTLVFVVGDVSKDGKYLYGISNIDSEFNRLIRYELATSKIEIITADIPWDVEFGAQMSNDKTKFLFSINEAGLTRLFLMDVATLKYRPIKDLPQGVYEKAILDKTGENVFVIINNARMNTDTFQVNLASNQLTRWTQSDTGGLDVSSFVIPQLIHYPTFDKVDRQVRKISAFYYQPKKKTGKPYPVIIYIHGGPEAQYKPTFQGDLNYMINELGVAIIAPNVRGSSGYGKSFLKLDNWEKREDSVKDIEALLDWIQTRPQLDKNRVAVFGGSYGGYMVLAAMFHYPQRIACGVDIVGISNFVTFLKNTSDYRRDLRRFEYGDERKIGEFLHKISPTTNANKITKPLFVIQGKNDPRVPASEAEQIVKTVRQNNVPVWYQMATNEGHGFSKKYNRDFMYYSIIKFFQEFLLK